MQAKTIEALTDDGSKLHGETRVGETALSGHGYSSRPLGYIITLLYVDRHTHKPIAKDRFFSIALHEIGHAIGLEHSENASDVMYATMQQVPTIQITEFDRTRITKMYLDQGANL